MPHITIEQAKERWHLSEKTILKYVTEGVIANLRVNNNILLLPDIKKPHYIGKKKYEPYKEIIRSTGEDEYIDYLLIYEEANTFSARITSLITERYLVNVNNQDGFTTNIGLILGPKGTECIKKNRFSITLNPSISINNQLGLINIGG